MRKSLEFLLSLKGNPKYCLFTEPLWGIPFILYMPFITVYMYHLGVLDFEIGLILALSRLAQVPIALIGGVVTDKFGRRLTTLVGDCISWSIPTLIWAFSQNFWWFLAAFMVNALMQITTVSWECLWVDDLDEKTVGPIYNWVYIAGLLAVFFAPISGYFVGIYGVVPVVRVLYLVAFVFMTAKFVILYIYSTETERGIERMAATKHLSIKSLLAGYPAVVKQILRSGKMVQALILQSMLGSMLFITGTFFALYTTQDLNIPEAFLAYFQILRAGVMLSFLLFIQSFLSKYNSRKILFAGLFLFIFTFILLLAAPVDNWVWIAVYTIINACASAMILPRVDTVAANAIEPKERARIRSIFNMIIIGISSPFVFFAGILSDINRQLPFVLILFLLVIMVVVVFAGKERSEAA